MGLRGFPKHPKALKPRGKYINLFAVPQTRSGPIPSQPKTFLVAADQGWDGNGGRDRFPKHPQALKASW